MQVTEIRSEGLTREFKVVVRAEVIETRIEKRLTQIGKTAKIPGFRPGKVPLKLLRQRFASSLMSEILEGAVNESSEEALQEKELRPAARPKIEITSYEEGNNLEYNMTLDVMPEVPDVDLAKLELERLYTEVDDAMIDEGLKKLAQRHKRFMPLTEPRESRSGDQVLFDYVGRIDGVAFDGDSGKDEEIELGSGRYIPGYEEQMVGARAGDHLEIKVTFPGNYRDLKVAGKEAVFVLDIKEIREPVAVKIDDDFAKAMGRANLAELRKALAQEMIQDFNELSRIRLKRVLSDALAEQCDFTLPEGMVADEFENLWQREQEQHQGQEDWDEEAKKEELRVVARRRVRLAILLSELGGRNDIGLDEAEVAKALKAEVARHPGQEREIVDIYKKSPGMMATLRSQAYEKKVLDFILEMAKVKDVKVSLEELLQSPEEAASAKG